MVSLEQKLKEKGWTEEEINHAMSVMYGKEPGTDKYQYKRGINPVLYWAGLIIAIVGNLMICVALIPFILVLNQTLSYIIISVLGMGFGGMFYFLLTDLERVNPTHHVVAGVFIPAIALITMYVMADIVNYVARTIGLNVTHNPIIISVIYVVSFTLPYAIGKLLELKELKAAKKAEKI